MQDLFQYATIHTNTLLHPSCNEFRVNITAFGKNKEIKSNSLELTEFLALPLATCTIIQIFSLSWAKIYFLNFKFPMLVTIFLSKPKARVFFFPLLAKNLQTFSQAKKLKRLIFVGTLLPTLRRFTWRPGDTQAKVKVRVFDFLALNCLFKSVVTGQI